MFYFQFFVRFTNIDPILLFQILETLYTLKKYVCVSVIKLRLLRLKLEIYEICVIAVWMTQWMLLFFLYFSGKNLPYLPEKIRRGFNRMEFSRVHRWLNMMPRILVNALHTPNELRNEILFLFLVSQNIMYSYILCLFDTETVLFGLSHYFFNTCNMLKKVGENLLSWLKYKFHVLFLFR